MTRRTLKSYGLNFKIEVLEEVSRGVKTKTEIAAFYIIPKSTLATFVKHKFFSSAAASRYAPLQKRVRGAKFEELEYQLYSQFQTVRNAGIPISGVIIKEKALKIATELEL